MSGEQQPLLVPIVAVHPNVVAATTTVHNGVGDHHHQQQQQQPSVVKPKKTTKPTSWLVYAVAGCAALNTCNVGFDIGISSPAGMLIQQDLLLSNWQLEVFMGSANLFSLVGALGNSCLVRHLGMKTALAIAAALALMGTALVASQDQFGLVLLIGRSWIGLGNGLACTVTPQYISEISPKEHRGFFTSWSEIGVNVGILVGFSMGFLFSHVESIGVTWRLMFAMGCILPVILLVLCRTVLVESPRWLVKNKRVNEAHEVLQRLMPHDTPNEQNLLLQEIIQNIQNDKERQRHHNNLAILPEHDNDYDDQGGQLQLCKSCDDDYESMGCFQLLLQARYEPAIRKMLFWGVGIAVAQELSGIDAIQYYLVFILNASGVTTREAQGQYLFALGVLKLSALFVAGALVDRWGRRPLLLLSLSGIIVSLLMVAASFVEDQNNELSSHLSAATTTTTTTTTGEDYTLVGLTNNDIYHTVTSNNNNDLDYPIQHQHHQSSNNFPVTIIGLALFLIFFSLGLGPLGWVMPPELFSTTIRSNAVSISTFANRLTATIMTTTMLSVAEWLSWMGYFVFLATLNLGIAVLIWIHLPETKGIKLEDVGRTTMDHSHSPHAVKK